MNKMLKPIPVFFQIVRLDEEKREVEGIAFANAIVPGEGGIELTPKAMKAATPDYEHWGCVRSMHQPIAAGTLARAVEWEGDTARICARVSDDGEWKKCKDGVYKGFSVLVTADEMKGNKVTRCTWIETSLVDRPKDPGAVFTMVRGEGVPARAGSHRAETSGED